MKRMGLEVSETDAGNVSMMGHKRNATIDAFRGLSIVAVMIFHYAVMGLGLPVQSMWGLGRHGVDVFFVISGFVIAMTAVRSTSWMDFAFRRFARIYPTFLIACTMTFLVLQLYPPETYRIGLDDYFASLTFAPDRLGYKYVDGVYWSLFVEALFYGTVAISIRALGKRFWIGVLGLLLFGAIARLTFSKAIGVLLIAPYSGFFLLGMAAWYGIREQDRRAATVLVLGSAVCFSLDPLISQQWPALPVAFIMLALLAFRVDSPLGPFAWIGRISYPLYLLHEGIGLSVIAAVGTKGVPILAAVFIASCFCLGLAWVFHMFIEERTYASLMSLWRSMRHQSRTTALPDWRR